MIKQDRFFSCSHLTHKKSFPRRKYSSAVNWYYSHSSSSCPSSLALFLSAAHYHSLFLSAAHHHSRCFYLLPTIIFIWCRNLFIQIKRIVYGFLFKWNSSFCNAFCWTYFLFPSFSIDFMPTLVFRS